MATNIFKNTSVSMESIIHSLEMARARDQTFLRFSNFFMLATKDQMAILYPVVAMISVSVTVTMIFGFIRGKLLGPTQRLLILIAVLDSCKVVLPTLFNLIILSMGKARGIIEYSVCHTFIVFNGNVPSTLHSITTWIKALLVFQRHYANVKPFKVKHFFTKKKYATFLTLAGVFAMVMEIALSDIFDIDKKIWVQDPDEETSLHIIEGCVHMTINSEAKELVLRLSTAIKAIVFGVIPVVSLLILDLQLFRNLRKQEMLRRTLISSTNVPPLLNVQRAISYIGISLFLQEMFYNAVLFTYVVTAYTLDGERSLHQLENLAYVSQVFLVASITLFRPVDVMVYAAASKKFRSAFRNIFK